MFDVLMAKVDDGAADRLAFRGGGGVLILLGAPLLAFGLLALYGGIASLFDKSMKAGDCVLIFTLAALLTAIGGFAVLARWGVTFDKRGGSATRWWGLLLPGLGIRSLRSTRRSLKEFEAVTVRREIRTGGKGQTGIVYAARLSAAGKPGLPLCAHRGPATVFGLAEEAARFLGLPLVNQAENEPAGEFSD